MIYQEIILLVSLRLGLPLNIVSSCYKHYWKFILDTLQNIPLKKEYTEEEFSKLKTSINIPELGKIGCDYFRYLNVRKKYGRVQEENAGRKSRPSKED